MSSLRNFLQVTPKSVLTLSSFSILSKIKRGRVRLRPPPSALAGGRPLAVGESCKQTLQQQTPRRRQGLVAKWCQNLVVLAEGHQHWCPCCLRKFLQVPAESVLTLSSFSRLSKIKGGGVRPRPSPSALAAAAGRRRRARAASRLPPQLCEPSVG